MSNFSSFKGDKLVGSSNYIEWKTNADLFLEINGYMYYIDGSESSPNKSLYYNIKTNTAKDGKETRSYGEPLSPELGARYADRLSEFNRNNKKALGALKSIISIDNNERFKDQTIAEDLYQAIITTFGQSSLELIGRYFNKIVDTNYNSFSNMDEYTSNIQSSIIYLKELKQLMPKPITAWLILKGLPSSFDSYASRKYEELAEDLNGINITKLITDLISEEGRINSNINLEANKASKNNLSYCKYCDKKGHIEDKCFIKYPELRNNYSNSNNKSPKTYKKGSKKPKVMFKKKQSTKAIMSALLEDNIIINNYNNTRSNKNTLDISNSINSLKITKNDNYSKEELEFLEIIKERVIKKAKTLNNSNSSNMGFILDSGASEHYTPYKDYLLDYKPVYNKTVIIANGVKLPIKGIGHIPVKINQDTFLIKNVNYVPNIKTTLISSKELTNKGWEILFKEDIAVLSYNNKIITNAKWHLNAYFLDKVYVNYETLEPVVYNITNYNISPDKNNINTNNTITSNLLDLYH